MPKETKAFEFGVFRLEIRERRLTRDGYPVPLHGKIFETLRVLVSNHGRLVTKDELIAAVWPDSVVEEGNLNHNICILRRALGEKATGQKYIETVPRQGYRFVAEVTEVDAPDASSIADAWDSFQDEPVAGRAEPESPVPPLDSLLQTETPASEQKPVPITRPREFLPRAIISLLAVAGILAIAYIELQRFGYMNHGSSSRTMLAVLPFENLTGNPGEDYISAGFDDEIISQLGQWNPAQVGVIARTSSRAYQGTRKAVGEIGRELGVDYIVEGSVRRDGNRVRVTVALVRVGDQAHLWSANYDGSMDNVLDLQVEVTRDIIQGITSRITAEPAARLDLSFGDLFQGPRTPAHFTFGLGSSHFLLRC